MRDDLQDLKFVITDQTLVDILARAKIHNLKELRAFQRKHDTVVLELTKFNETLLKGITYDNCLLLELLLNT